MANISTKNKITRVVIKIPSEVADYLRSAFPHGKRSEFIARCILIHKHEQEVEKMEESLRQSFKKRQN